MNTVHPPICGQNPICGRIFPVMENSQIGYVKYFRKMQILFRMEIIYRIKFFKLNIVKVGYLVISNIVQTNQPVTK